MVRDRSSSPSVHPRRYQLAVRRSRSRERENDQSDRDIVPRDDSNERDDHPDDERRRRTRRGYHTTRKGKEKGCGGKPPLKGKGKQCGGKGTN
eukprot:6491469-Amphidinium_carterae.3